LVLQKKSPYADEPVLKAAAAVGEIKSHTNHIEKWRCGREKNLSALGKLVKWIPSITRMKKKEKMTFPHPLNWLIILWRRYKIIVKRVEIFESH
jgi:hypothetical protein